jgi:hypothetical protein
MLVASAALAALLLGAYFLTPVMRLHYHAWRYRSGRDPTGTHLEGAVKHLVNLKAGEDVVRRFLGEPSARFPVDAKELVALHYHLAQWGDIRVYEVLIQRGRVASVRSWTQGGTPPPMPDPPRP